MNLERDRTVITWDVFFKFMISRYDSSDLVAQARAKLDKVYQGIEGVERYVERFMSLLAIADIEKKWECVSKIKLIYFSRG